MELEPFWLLIAFLHSFDQYKTLSTIFKTGQKLIIKKINKKGSKLH